MFKISILRKNNLKQILSFQEGVLSSHDDGEKFLARKSEGEWFEKLKKPFNLGLFHDDRLVAVATFETSSVERYSSYKKEEVQELEVNENICLISSNAVLKDYEGQGHMKNLRREMFAQIKRAGFGFAMTSVREDNHRMNHIVSKEGFSFFFRIADGREGYRGYFNIYLKKIKP